MSKTYTGLTTNGVTELTLQEEGVGNIGTQTIVWDGATNGVIDQVQGDIPDSWKQNGDIKQLQIGSSCTSIGSYAFYYCGSVSTSGGIIGPLTIPNSVTLTLSENLTSIGNDSLSYGYGFTGDLVIPDSVTSIGDYAFNDCAFDGSLTIGNSVTVIGVGAFSYCASLTGSLVIPDSVTTIGDYAFQFCSGCTLLAIGNSVTSIGEAAFVDCSNLTEIYVNCPASSWVGTFALGNTNIAPVTMYVNGVTALGYTAGAQTFQGKPLTIVEWTNYPNIP